MDTSQLGGVYPPVFTPFHPDGSLNVGVVPTYAKYLYEGGIQGVYITGTAGEGMSLTVQERKCLTEAWVEAAQTYSLKTIIQVGAGSLVDTQDLARHAESKGVTAIATFPNLFDKPQTVEDLVDYCLEVSIHAPKTPLLYYHIPFKTGVTVPMDKFLEVGCTRVPTLAGMKYTDEDVSGEGARCVTAAGGCMCIFSGFDELFSEALQCGYCGAVSCSFNFLPKEGLTIFKNSGTGKESEIAQAKINDTLALIFRQTGGFSVAALKTAMASITGINVGPPRKPLKNLTTKQTKALQEDLRQAGFSIA